MKRAIHGGADHPDVAATLHELGAVCKAAGDLAGARRHLEESLVMKLAIYGDDEHPAVAATLHVLGVVCKAEDDLAGARLLLEESLRMYCVIHSDTDHPDVSKVLHDLKALDRLPPRGRCPAVCFCAAFGRL